MQRQTVAITRTESAPSRATFPQGVVESIQPAKRRVVPALLAEETRST
jgi:hypothetical protein